MAEFHRLHPDVELGMIEGEPDVATAALKAGDIDLALVYDFEALPDMLDSDLELTQLVDDRYDVILPLGHRLAKKRQLRMADLADEPWIASTDTCGCRQITESACRDAGFEPRIAFEADETLAAQALVAAGVGVTILPRLALSTVHPSVVARSHLQAAHAPRLGRPAGGQLPVAGQRGDGADPPGRGGGVPRSPAGDCFLVRPPSRIAV